MKNIDKLRMKAFRNEQQLLEKHLYPAFEKMRKETKKHSKEPKVVSQARSAAAVHFFLFYALLHLCAFNREDAARTLLFALESIAKSDDKAVSALADNFLKMSSALGRVILGVAGGLGLDTTDKPKKKARKKVKRG